MAVPHYLRAGSGADNFWPTSNGCKSVALIQPSLNADTGDKSDRQSDTPLRFYRQPRKTSKPLAVITAADPIYLHKFGDRYFQSVKEYALDASVHLHLMNSNEEDPATIDQAILSGRWPEMTVTLENVDLAERLPYFACARFIHAVQFLNCYESPVLISDIDAVLNAPLQSALLPLNETDIGLRIKKTGFSPPLADDPGRSLPRLPH